MSRTKWEYLQEMFLQVTVHKENLKFFNNIFQRTYFDRVNCEVKKLLKEYPFNPTIQ